jgi:cytochrome c
LSGIEMKTTGWAVVAAIVIGVVSLASAQADTTEALDGEMLYLQRTCFTCHGKDGKTPILPDYPKLAGQGAPYLLQQMKDIKSGARSNSNSAAMRGIMHLVNDEEMGAIASYIASLEP